MSPPQHAVIGPNSNVTVTMIGDYADVAHADDKQFGAAINAASQADATVLVMGLDQSIEAETVDRAGLLLPGRQQDLVSKVAATSKGPNYFGLDVRWAY